MAQLLCKMECYVYNGRLDNTIRGKRYDATPSVSFFGNTCPIGVTTWKIII
ncbi:MAG: hypothetical protein ACLVEJ_19800 [Parabacteroides sp.]